MFSLYANKNQQKVCQREPVTSGSSKVYLSRFEFSPDWDGMERVAVFRAGVRGTRVGEEVLPTTWADLGTILPGVTAAQDARPPAPDLWKQELAQKGDRLEFRQVIQLGAL